MLAPKEEKIVLTISSNFKQLQCKSMSDYVAMSSFIYSPWSQMFWHFLLDKQVMKLLWIRCVSGILHEAFWVPWYASWPFSAGSVWCVSCCLDPKAPASSTAPSTAVVWHVCKHTGHRVSQQASSSRKESRHLHKHTDKSLSTQKLIVLFVYCEFDVLRWEWWLKTIWSDLVFTSDFWPWNARSKDVSSLAVYKR